MNNPFQTANNYSPSGYSEKIDVQSRLEAVRNFTANQLKDVLALSDIQKTVRKAAERRLRKLQPFA